MEEFVGAGCTYGLLGGLASGRTGKELWAEGLDGGARGWLSCCWAGCLAGEQGRGYGRKVWLAGLGEGSVVVDGEEVLSCKRSAF